MHGGLLTTVVLFAQFDYVRHFLNACTRILGLESSHRWVEYHGRLVTITICALGISMYS